MQRTEVTLTLARQLNDRKGNAIIKNNEREASVEKFEVSCHRLQRAFNVQRTENKNDK